MVHESGKLHVLPALMVDQLDRKPMRQRLAALAVGRRLNIPGENLDVGSRVFSVMARDALPG